MAGATQLRKRSTKGSRVLWVYRRGRRQGESEVRQGCRSTEFWYGQKSIDETFSGTYIEDPQDLFSKLTNPLNSWVARRLGMGFVLGTCLSHWRTVQKSDLIITTQDSGGLPFAWLKSKGLIRSRIVYISQGLTDRIDAMGNRYPLLRNELRKAVSAVDGILVWGEGAVAPLEHWLGENAPPIHAVPFGVNTVFWSPNGQQRGATILSVGSDPWRDYKTLLNAAGELPMQVVTRLPLEGGKSPQLEMPDPSTDAELRELYQKARMVVVPVKDVSQPSGQSTVIQAMACETPVIMTKSRGFWAEGILEDGVHCLMVPPEDPSALKAAIQKLNADEALRTRLGGAARKQVCRHLSEEAMARAIQGRLEDWGFHV